MSTLNEAVEEFLAQKRIAVAGVSREGGLPSNSIYKKLKDHGYQVFPINPKTEEVEGDKCYPNLQAIPNGVDGVVIATHPKATEEIVHDCAEVGVSRVWIHRSFGQGSVSDSAVDYCRENNISVIAGGCPMMFCDPDVAHKCIRWILGVTGSLPKEV